MSTPYKAVTDISSLEYTIPEIDFACVDNITLHPLEIIKDISYNHRIVLADIDISANVFKKMFYDIQKPVETFNTFTNSFMDYKFQLLPAPPTATDVSYVIDGKTYLYYADLSKYISILSPTRQKYQTGDIFCLQDELVENIILDLRSINTNYEKLINTCSFIDFNKEVTDLKTLNDVIPSSNVSLDFCALDWSNVLELIRCEYDDVIEQNAPKFAILMMTLIFKTTINIRMPEMDYFVSTTEVKLRYKIDFNELPEFHV